MTAGAAQRAGESRLSLAGRNAKLFGDIVPRIEKHAPETILLIVTNPVDVLTYVSMKLTSLPRNRVIGSGTILDTSRLRYELAKHCSVAPHNVHAYIIGEHGDTEVPVWSLANVAGMRLLEQCPLCKTGFDEHETADLFESVKNAAYRIIEAKGATYYAIAMGVSRLVEAILGDEQIVLCVSTLVEQQYDIDDICLSLPCVIGRGGIREVLPLSLTSKEQDLLRQSAAKLREVLDTIDWNGP